MDEPIKIKLMNRGADVETPWAEDLGAAESHGLQAPAGSRVVRLANVPFLHAKPTLGDVIVVSPAANGDLVWDRDGLPWSQIGSRILDDGGRWAMIVDYMPLDDTTDEEAFEALGKVAEGLNIVVEGAWGPKDDGPGRIYFAVLRERDDRAVMAELLAQAVPCELVQIHPARAPEPDADDDTPESPQVNLLPKEDKPKKAKPPKAVPVKAKPAANDEVAPATKAGKAAAPAAKPAAKAKAAPAAKPAAKAKAAKPAAKPATKLAAKGAKPAAKAGKPAAKAAKVAKPAAQAAKTVAKPKAAAKKPVAKKPAKKR